MNIDQTWIIHNGESEVEHLQSARKSERPNTNPMYDVAIARSENTSTIGCRKFLTRKIRKFCSLEPYAFIL